MEIIAHYGTNLLILTCFFAFLMAWGVGANDVSNAMGTSVGSKAITIKQAIVIAMVFEFAGAYLAGGEVTSTIRNGIIDPEVLTGEPELLIFGMMSALLAAAIWLFIASLYGWPVSTTHSIVGAIVGFAAVGISVDAVQWSKVGTIVTSWITSPLLAGIIAFSLFKSVQSLILNTEDPFEKAKKYVPYYMFLTGFLVSMVTFLKGLSHVGLNLSGLESILYSIACGIVVATLGKILLNRIQPRPIERFGNRFDNVERVFAVLMLFTACAMAFAHGSNDVANAVGPLAAVVSVIANDGEILARSPMPVWVLLLGAIGIVIGLATLGYRVIATIGRKITELTPSRGFAAELAAAATVVSASGLGIPVSTTHTLVGAVLGVGMARGIGAIDLKVVGTIFTSWIVTLPAGAGLSILFYFILRAIFV
jgi:PiT family inorganic phosphate transporter